MPTQSEQEFKQLQEEERRRAEESRILKEKAEAAAEKARIEKLRMQVSQQKSKELIAKREALKESEEREAAERAERVKALLEAEKLIAQQQSELAGGVVTETGAIKTGIKAQAMLLDIRDQGSGMSAMRSIVRRRSQVELEGFQEKIAGKQSEDDFAAEKRKVQLDMELGRLRMEQDEEGNLYFVNPATGMTVIDIDPVKFGYTELPDANDFVDEHVITSVALPPDATLADIHARKQQRDARRAMARDVENRATAFLASLADFNIKLPEPAARAPRRGSSESQRGSPQPHDTTDAPSGLKAGDAKAGPIYAVAAP